MGRFTHVIIRHCLKSLCEEDNQPQEAHSRNPIGAHTYPLPSWLSQLPNKALCTCLLICMVPWSFSEMLGYRAVPINITPELSINNLIWKQQAVSKPVHLWTYCWTLLCSGTQSPELLWSWITFWQLLPCCPSQQGAGWPPRPCCGRDSMQTFWTSLLSPSLNTQENPQWCFLRPKYSLQQLQSWVLSHLWETGKEQPFPGDLCQAEHAHVDTPVSQAFSLLCKQPNGQTPPARLRQMEQGGRLRVCGARQRSCALQLQLMKLIWWADYSCVLVRCWHGAPHCTGCWRKGTTQTPDQAFHLSECTAQTQKTGFWISRRRRSPSL